MATTFVEYTGDGQASKQFTFPSYQESDVKVRVDGVLKTTSTHYNITGYTTTGGGNVVFTSGNIPSSPAKIRIYRDTSVDVAKATYTAGSSVKAADLNNNNTQLLYRAQEEQVPNLIQTYDINDDAITASKIADGTIVTGNLANSSVTQDKLANNSVGTPELINGSVTSAKIADGTIVNADVNASAAIAGTKINPDFGTQNLVTTGTAVTGSLGVLGDLDVDGDIDFVGSNRTVDGRDVSVDGAKLDTIETNAKDDQTAAEIKTLLQSDKLTASEIAEGALDGRYFTETESDARYFNISSGETIKDGDTFPDNDTTIATTAAINDRIIDLIDDVGGFDIIQSEQHFPNTNPQGTTGQAAVLSIKAATTNLVPSGTTVTISNGNLANNANITITGVTSTIPTGFGFLVESTSTTHTYAFHRLVPKATEVTTIASNISNINSVNSNESNINAAVSNASNINAAVANASNINAAVSNASNINAAVSNASNINSAVSNASNITTTASNIANVNNVGTNIAKVNSVAAVLGGTQTFTVTVSGGVFYIDGQSKPVLTLARGFTYTFNQADSSNSGHPLAFRDSSDNAYTTGVTVNGTAGNSGATVVFAVPSNAPNSLKYYCTVHGNGMGNTITVTDDNIGTVAGSISNVNTVAGSIANVNTTAGSISNVNTVASNINSVNSFFNVYRTGANNPTTSLDTGDLFFNTTSNSLKVYTGSAWVDGVTATGNFAVTTGNTFTGSNVYNDNAKALFGTGSDMEIFHDGTHSHIIERGSGNLAIHTDNELQLAKNDHAGSYELMGKFLADGAAELYYDGSVKIVTQSAGVTVTGNIFPSASDTHALGGSSARWQELNISDVIDISDNGKIRIGDGDDLQIYHDGTDSRIENTTNGDLKIINGGNSAMLIQNQNSYNIEIKTNAKDAIKCIANSAVELYHNNSKKLETTSSGVTVTGDLVPEANDTRALGTGSLQWAQSNIRELKVYEKSTHYDNVKAVFGHGEDLSIFHDGNNSFIRDTGTGQLRLDSSELLIRKYGSTEKMARFTGDGAAELYYDNSVKLETQSWGVDITGDCRATELKLEDNNYLSIGSGNDLRLRHTGSQNQIIAANAELMFQCNTFNFRNENGSENFIHATENGAVNLYYDNSLKLETASTGVKVTGTVIKVNDNSALTGTAHNYNYGRGTGATSALSLYGAESAIELVSTDDGTHGGSLLLRTTNDGAGFVYNPTDNALELKTFSTSQDNFALHNNGSHTNQDVQLRVVKDGDVELYYNGSKKLETTNTGALVSGLFEARQNSTATDFTVTSNPALSSSGICSQNIQGAFNTFNALTLVSHSANAVGMSGSIIVKNHSGSGYSPSIFITQRNGGNSQRILQEMTSAGACKLNYNGSKKLETTNDGVTITGDLTVTDDITLQDDLFMGDGDAIKLGDSQDTLMYHSGSSFHLFNQTGNLHLNGNSILIKNYDNDESYIRCSDDDSVKLYYNNSEKLRTVSTGVHIPIGRITLANDNGWHGEIGGSIQHHSNYLYFIIGSNGGMFRSSSGTDRLLIDSSGNVRPAANNQYDLGTSSYRWKNIYTQDLQLSNEAAGDNGIDGTWGNYTIVEGESDLFLKNNRSGKTYKFNLTEVS